MEQNTDRMYWTVGIIIVGAIVVGGAAALFPGLITQVGAKITEAITSIKLPGAAG